VISIGVLVAYKNANSPSIGTNEWPSKPTTPSAVGADITKSANRPVPAPNVAPAIEETRSQGDGGESPFAQKKIRKIKFKDFTPQMKAACSEIETACFKVMHWTLLDDPRPTLLVKTDGGFEMQQFPKNESGFSELKESPVSRCFERLARGKVITDLDSSDESLGFQCRSKHPNVLLDLRKGDAKAQDCFASIPKPARIDVRVESKVVGMQVQTTVTDVSGVPPLDASAARCVAIAFEIPPIDFTEENRPGFESDVNTWSNDSLGGEEGALLALTPSSKLINPTDERLAELKQQHTMATGTKYMLSFHLDYAQALVARYSNTKESSLLPEIRQVLTFYLGKEIDDKNKRKGAERALAAFEKM
jgi:hypothetical protein